MLTHPVTRPEDADQSRLLRLLRDDGPRPRAELPDALDLPRPKTAQATTRLLALGLVHDLGQARSRGGRRSTVLGLDPTLRFVGVDIGATSIDVAVTGGGLELHGQRSEIADVRDGPVSVLGRVLELIGKFRADGLLPTLGGVGIGLPGPVSFRDGAPVAPPLMPGWHGFPVRDTLASELGCPVVVDNDVNVMAVGEQAAGVAYSVADFLLVKIGTGIGCGIIVHGCVYRGVDGCAGDIGHINVDPDGPLCTCGNVGCLESLFGGAALVRDALAASRSGRSEFLTTRLAAVGRLSAEDVSMGAASGDAACVDLMRTGGQRVGSVLAALVSALNPSLIVIGGGLSRVGHLLLAEIRGVVYRRSLPLATGNLPIVLSELGSQAGVLGAAALASEALFAVPGSNRATDTSRLPRRAR